MIVRVGEQKEGNYAALRRAKLSINVSGDISERLRYLAHGQRLSESSIVEVALKSLFGHGDDAELGTLLRQRGASLRSK